MTLNRKHITLFMVLWLGCTVSMFWVGDFSWRMHDNTGRIYLKPNGNRGLDLLFSTLYSIPVASLSLLAYWCAEKTLLKEGRKPNDGLSGD